MKSTGLDGGKHPCREVRARARLWKVLKPQEPFAFADPSESEAQTRIRSNITLAN